jgi:cytochrome c-type biogenesis protein CcmF
VTPQAPFSPIALVGTLALLSAYALAAYCVAAGIAGNARKSRRLVSSSVYGLYAFAALIALASALMIYGFVTHDFSIKYVAKTSDVTMSTWYKVTSFWGGLDGSLLFWVLVLSLFSTVAIAFNHKRHRDMIGYVVGTIMVVQVFFLSLLVFTKNPFATFLTNPPTDGEGLNPLLQNYWMVIHPPSLYTGFVAATIPFAFCIGALASGRLDDLWLGAVRVWMMVCFGFLSLGLILGGRWAYEILGWGGYWAWDPVENAGMMPWFTATAYLHSAIIQEQRGMMKTWNVSLVVLTFFLTVFGTFMTRSGAVQSVHAFGEDNVLALQFIVFMAVILIVSIGLIVYRAPQLATKMKFDSFYSREFAFLLNNWILLGCAFFVLFATMFPTISEALDGSRVSVGPEFFNKWMTALGLVLVFLSGAAPLLAWRKTTRARLWSQFAFPTIAAGVTVVVCLVAFPQTTHLSPLFADAIQLPMSLVDFAIIAFVAASIAQEFWRGGGVRKKRSGSDVFTSMVGLALAKRRKYGGYIIHLGVALMFLGFAGKAYEREDRHSVEKSIETMVKESQLGQQALAEPDAGKRQDMLDRAAEQIRAAEDAADATAYQAALDRNDPNVERRGPVWTRGGYTYSYERLIHTSDDHQDVTSAQVDVYRDGKHLGSIYPSLHDYHRSGERPAKSPAIMPRYWLLQWSELGAGDVYVVLDGWGDPSRADLQDAAQFVTIQNPLILWVWAGFLVLAFGTLWCLIPQSLVDRVQRRPPRTRLGQAADAGILLAIVFGVVAGIASQAHAAPGGGEHVPAAGRGMGGSTVGWSTRNLPNSDTAKSLMKEILCPCGCARQDILVCECQTAAELRGLVLERLAGFDLSTSDGRDDAYKAVIDSFVRDYGGEQVLATPRNSVSWLLPSIAVVGGLGLLVFVGGRRWIRRDPPGPPKPPAGGAAPPSAEDDKYADKLDDELDDADE